MKIVKDLWAKPGTITMPDGAEIPVWGYAESASSPPQLPGPVFEASVGDNIQVNLHNLLGEPVSIIFPGQNITPTPVRDAGGKLVSYTAHAQVYGDTVSYSFTADRPGIFLYESGSSPEKQIQMGMYGLIIVRPADFNPDDPGLRTAYGVNTRSEFDVEQFLVLNEIDSRLHFKIADLQPYDFHDYDPDYWTLNGRAYPHSIEPSNASSQPYGSKITGSQGEKILLRCVNAGFQHHNLRFDTLAARVVGIDSVPLSSKALDKTYQKNTVTIASGESYDVIITASMPGKYLIYDRDYNHVLNVNSFLGGIMTLIEVI